MFQIINYTINKRKNIKNITLRIKGPDNIVVSAPTNVSDSYIDKVVKSKEAWLNSKLEELKKTHPLFEVKNFIDRKQIPYLGVNYDFIIYEKSDIYKFQIHFKDDKFIAYVPKNTSVETRNTELRMLSINLVINESMQLVKDKVAYYSKLLNVFPKKIQIKDQKSSWGTCSSLGNIYFNYRILFAPNDVLDYVIIHELCHLRHMDHSKDFWNLVSSICPNYIEYRNWLRINGHSLDI